MACGGLGDWGFPKQARRRIQFVRRAKELGFTTREAGKLLSLRVETPPDRAAVKELVDLSTAVWNCAKTAAEIAHCEVTSLRPSRAPFWLFFCELGVGRPGPGSGVSATGLGGRACGSCCP